MVANLRGELRDVALAAGDPVDEQVERERRCGQPLDRPVVQVGRDPPALGLGALDRPREEPDAVVLGALELRQRDGELALRRLRGLPSPALTIGTAQGADVRKAEGGDEQSDDARRIR